MKNFLGIPIKINKKDQLFSIKEYPIHLITLNAQYFVKAQKNEKLLHIIKNNYTCIDGEVPKKMFKVLYPKVDIEKISGSDLIYDFSFFAKKNGLKIFLLGGNRLANETSANILSKKFNIEVGGYSNPLEDYPFSIHTNEKIEKEIKNFRPDILFVGYGLLKQDYWINDNFKFLENNGVKFVIGSGGTFDFVSKKIKRAPKIIQDLGLEMIFRFIVQPNKNRLFRIFQSLPLFYYYLKYIIKDKKR